MDLEAAKVVPGVRVENPFGLDGADHAVAAGMALLQGTARVPEFKFARPAGALGNHMPDLPEYQLWGRDFIGAGLKSGVLVRDDVGLGKTVQTCRALKGSDPVKVVLCPAFLRTQWAAEIERWTGEQAFIWKPASMRRKKDQLFNSVKYRWVVGYYAEAQHIIDVLGYTEYVLILDEIHNLRGLKTERAQLLQGACNFAAGRVGLTASLLINDGPKMFSILNLIQPGAFGTYYDFTSRYCGGKRGAFGWETDKELHCAEELRARLTYFSFRRVREDVAEQLPFSTRFQTLRVDVPVGLRGPMLLSVSKNPGMMQTYLAQLAAAKADAVLEAVANDITAGVPSITFTYLRDQARDLAARTPGALCLHGEVPAEHRLARMREWLGKCATTGIVPALFTTLDAMGEGANLQWAKAVNFAALDYTPDRLRQAIGRVARMGQVGEVNVRIFIANRTADEHYVDLLIRKLKENFRLDGRQEQGKLSLESALSPKATAAAMGALFEKYRKAEFQ